MFNLMLDNCVGVLFVEISTLYEATDGIS